MEPVALLVAVIVRVMLVVMEAVALLVAVIVRVMLDVI